MSIHLIYHRLQISRAKSDLAALETKVAHVKEYVARLESELPQNIQKALAKAETREEVEAIHIVTNISEEGLQNTYQIALTHFSDE
jgi:hypothetical protein